jgi:hypothetical protein
VPAEAGSISKIHKLRSDVRYDSPSTQRTHIQRLRRIPGKENLKRSSGFGDKASNPITRILKK